LKQLLNAREGQMTNPDLWQSGCSGTKQRRSIVFEFNPTVKDYTRKGASNSTRTTQGVWNVERNLVCAQTESVTFPHRRNGVAKRD